MSSSFRRRTAVPGTGGGTRNPRGRIGGGPLSSSSQSPPSPAVHVHVLELVGTKPWVGGATLTSSGLREFDAILGGGQPLGTAMLIEEDRWTQDLALALVRYWAAEAVAQEQSLSLIATIPDVDALAIDTIDNDTHLQVPIPIQAQHGMSPTALRHFLNMLPRDQHLDKARAKSDAMDKKIEQMQEDAVRNTGIHTNSANIVSSLQGFGTIQEGDHDEDEDEDDFEEEETTSNGADATGNEGLTNAWQYKLSVQRERGTGTGTGTGGSSARKPKGSKQYCHSFDLSGKMMDQHDASIPTGDVNIHTHISILDCACSKCPLFSCHQSRSCAVALYQSFVQHIQDKISQHPNTVVRILVMNAPVQTFSVALPLLLTHVRMNALPVVCLMTVRPWLRPLTPRSTSNSNSSYAQSLISLKRSCDAVFTCEGFAANLSPPPAEFSDLAGILSIRKVALQALGHFSDTTTNRRPPANRYGMKRDRRKMHIRMLHLPPEDFSKDEGSGGSGPLEKGDGGTTTTRSSKTALQPGMGCASNRQGGSASSLEF